MTPRDCIVRIREYTEANPELKQSHHFVFDLRFKRNARRFLHMVIALNPSEDDDQWARCPTPTEESSEYNFHDHYGASPGALKWRDEVLKYCGTLDVVQSEFFLWSTKDSDKAFKKLYGVSLKRSPHLEFCRDMNLHLVDYHRPIAIIAPGISLAAQFADLYKLTHVEDITPKDGRKLIAHYECNGRPWVFTKHWTGSRDFTREQKEFVKLYISKLKSQS